MKGFALDENGDTVLKKEEIGIVEGTKLLTQTCRQVIGTNKGEWFLNGNEGINFDNILCKNPDKNLVRDEVQSGLFQVDDSLRIQKISQNTGENRKLSVRFTAVNDSGENVGVGQKYDK